MSFIRNNLPVIIFFAVCIAGLYLYQTYFVSGTPADVLSTESATPTLSGSALLSSLSDLRAVTLDGAIFNDPVFDSLIDYGINIPPEPVGRPNPFAPLTTQAGSQGGSAGVTPASVKKGAAATTTRTVR